MGTHFPVYVIFLDKREVRYLAIIARLIANFKKANKGFQGKV